MSQRQSKIGDGRVSKFLKSAWFLQAIALNWLIWTSAKRYVDLNCLTGYKKTDVCKIYGTELLFSAHVLKIYIMEHIMEHLARPKLVQTAALGDKSGTINLHIAYPPLSACSRSASMGPEGIIGGIVWPDLK